MAGASSNYTMPYTRRFIQSNTTIRDFGTAFRFRSDTFRSSDGGDGRNFAGYWTTEMADTYRYFTHEMDVETHFCVRCGRFRMDLQERQAWAVNEVKPACVEADNVVAISHRTRARLAS